MPPKIQPTVLMSSSVSTYPALVLFFLGFRIVGMEALNVFQSFQLLLHSYNVESLILTFNVHGYTDSAHFPIEIPVKNHIFSQFNFMYILLICLFAIGVVL